MTQELESELRHQIGQKAGRYELVRYLGEGGMGEVWEAVNPQIGKRVAIKFLLPQFSTDPVFVERFRREAMVTANLHHPNICSAIDFESSDEETYLVLDFVEGAPLSSLIAKGRNFLPAEVVEISSAICSGLAQAHKKGVVHRDLKPDNIMIVGENFSQLKLLDFGIATSLNDGRLTEAGQAIGTPTYMAPEQVMAVEITTHADQYALGIIMYELVVGKTPFEFDSTFEILEAQLRTAVPNVSQIVPATPEALSKLIAILTNKDPAKRYKDLGEVYDELQSLDLSQAQEDSQTSRLVAMGVVALLTIIVSIGAWSFMLNQADDVIENVQTSSFESQKLEASKFKNIEEADAALAKTPKNPHLIAQRASLLAPTNITQALDDYAAATILEKRYLGDPNVSLLIQKCIRASKCKSLKPRGWDLSIPEAAHLREQLFQLAAQGTSKTHKLGYEFLEKFEGLKELEDWQGDVMLMNHKRKCDARTQAIDRLKGIAEAKPFLESLAKRPTRGCGFLKMKDCIACLRKPLRKALTSE